MGSVGPTAWTAPAEVVVTTDLYEGLSARERAMIPLLLEACAEMDAIFWQEAYGDRDALLHAIEDGGVRRFAEFNYGPWDRRRGNAPFVAGVGPKPPGAGFYPPDMDRAEFDAACAESPERAAALQGPHSLVRRDGAGRLVAIAYHDAFAGHLGRAAASLREAASLADDPGLRRYLELRAAALLDDDYRVSDIAWLDTATSGIDLIIGPLEAYEDALFGRKTAHEGLILLKDHERSTRLERLAEMLPDLQRGLPVPDAYKHEMPGVAGAFGVYDVVAAAGDAAARAWDAISLPNDEELQLAKGTRRLLIRNAMRAIFERMTAPLADRLVARDQRPSVEFEAYFAFVLCHEIAHGLGVKHTVEGTSTVREALLDQHLAVEEGKADSVGLHMLARLVDAGELAETTLIGCYVTFVAELIRQIRKGPASEYARASLASLGFLEAAGAITRDPAAGTYRVDMAVMRDAIDALAERYLRLQGDGDPLAAAAFVPVAMTIDPTLQSDLDRLAAAEVPTAVWFRPAPHEVGAP